MSHKTQCYQIFSGILTKNYHKMPNSAFWLSGNALQSTKITRFSQRYQIWTWITPKMPILAFLTNFLAKISQKSGNAFHRVVRFRPGYPQKLRILAFLTNFWQKSGNTSFCDLPTNQDQWNENWRDLNLIWAWPEPTSVYVK